MISTKKNKDRQLKVEQLKAQASKDYSFDDVKNAFFASDKNGLDPVLVDFASNWFDAITKDASRSVIGDDPKQDEKLLYIAFSDEIGRETFDKLKKCYRTVFNTTTNQQDFAVALNMELSSEKNNISGNKYGNALFNNLAHMENWYTKYGFHGPDFNPNIIGDRKFIDNYKFEQATRAFMGNCYQAKLAQQKLELEKDDNTIFKKVKKAVKKVFTKESEQDDKQITNNIQTPK